MTNATRHPPAHPAFAALAPLLDGGLESLTLDQLNALARVAYPSPRSDTGAPIRFVAAGKGTSALEYESRILRTGCVAAREGVAHDLLNALCWIAFPNVKRACNALHAVRAGGACCGRGTPRDALTLFDESGVIALCADRALATMLAERKWRALFVESRMEAVARLQFFVCGHALYEKLLDPYPGITGRVVVAHVSMDAMAADLRTRRAIADTAAARLLWTIESPAAMPPLPLCGVPGWDARNEAPSFYDDRAVFRTRPSIASGNCATDSHSAAAPDSSSSSVEP